MFQVGIVYAELEADGKWNSTDAIALLEISKKGQGLSGRSLRKLPVLAHAWFVCCDKVELDKFIDALDQAVDKHLSDTIAFNKHSK